MNNQFISSGFLLVLYLIVIKRIFPTVSILKKTLKEASIFDVFAIFQGHGIAYEESDLRVSLFVLSTVVFLGGQYVVWLFVH